MLRCVMLKVLYGAVKRKKKVNDLTMKTLYHVIILFELIQNLIDTKPAK